MNVVTRFAPSPTGYVHVGSQRTALYNYIFARQQKGKFILRVEDTDQNRYVEGAVENLLSSLEQLGIEFDAGPGKEDDKGPYFQSERNDIYSREVQKLMDQGHAYRCFVPANGLMHFVRNKWKNKPRRVMMANAEIFLVKNPKNVQKQRNLLFV